MNKNSKIYVAGHRGLVGSAIMKRLLTDGYTNIVIKSSSDLDLTDQADVDKFFSEEKPEYVFLGAAKVGGILANSIYPAEFIYENIMIGTNVIHASYKYEVKKLINFGSSCIYPRLAPQPMKEDSLLTSELEPTNEAYAVAKIAIIKLCKYYNQQYGTEFISVMPTNQYGENDNFNMETAHAFPMLIRRFHLAKLLQKGDFAGIRNDIKKYPLGFSLNQDAVVSENDKDLEFTLNKFGAYRDKIVVWGDGSVYREFMSSDDLVDACIYLIKNKSHKDVGEVINITSGTDIQLKDLYEIIRKVVGFNGIIEFDTTKPNGAPRKFMDATKIQSLGWKPKVSLEDGTKKLYTWYANVL